MKNKKNIVIVEIILSIVMTTLIIGVVIYEVRLLTKKELYKNLQSMKTDNMTIIINTDDDKNKPGEISIDDPAPDFIEMKKLNPDIFAYICINGTKVEYPIVNRRGDNNFYLNHNIDGSYGLPGCVYTEDINGNSLNSPITIIYGHNMRDKSMFGALHSYMDADYFSKNNIITIYEQDNNNSVKYEYEIIAAGSIGDEYIPTSYDINDVNSIKAIAKKMSTYKNYIENASAIENIGNKDKAVILSTCNSGNNRVRYLVVGLLKYE